MTMPPHNYDHPEPVPAASQLAVLPFLAAVGGFLEEGREPGIRVTIHRAMNREGYEYLQQVCDYIGPEAERKGGGRMFRVDTGIIGAAFETGKIWRTKEYPTKDALLVDLRLDKEDTGDKRPIETDRRSWLAIPFVGKNSRPILILYADTFELNFFADNHRLQSVVNMCNGFTRLVDVLEAFPFPNLRNFPLRSGEGVKGGDLVYPRIQEQISDVPPPKFQKLTSFNYEASVS